MKQQATAKLIVFVIKPQSIIDVITNSSSELFIFHGKEKEVVEELIKSIYLNYRDEYAELRSLRSLNTEELDHLISRMTGAHCWPAKKSDYHIPGTFTFDELYEPKDEKPAWNGEIQYRLKRNQKDPKYEWSHFFVIEENKEWVLNKLDPTNTMFLLYSYDENPDFDMQEKLEIIGSRIHLG